MSMPSPDKVHGGHCELRLLYYEISNEQGLVSTKWQLAPFILVTLNYSVPVDNAILVCMKLKVRNVRVHIDGRFAGACATRRVVLTM
jgi:hypothetical protein